MTGSPGAQGAQGPIGPNGATGVPGSPGVQGPQGVQGPTGEMGPRGATGTAGAPGVQGMHGITGPQGQAGPGGPQGPIGPRGATGPAGASGTPGMQGSIGPRGATGPKGDRGEAAHIDHVEAITGEPGGPAYAYNSGTDEHADLVFVIPAGPTGPEGPMGPTGRAGAGCDTSYGGLYNTDTGEFCTQPGEVAAMTFSDTLPALGMHCDCNHSLVLERDGVYEIHYALRAASHSRSQLYLAVTNDGVILPCSRVCKDVAGNSAVDVSGFALAEAKAGAHIHFIAYGGEGADSECYTLCEGVNLMLYAKRLGDLAGCGCGG